MIIMKIKNIFFIILFLIATSAGSAQSIEDFLEKESHISNNDEVTMIVDRDIPQKGAVTEAEEVKQDSLKIVNDKWKSYLTEKNEAVLQLSHSIQEINPKKTKKEEVDKLILQVNFLKKDFDNRRETNGLWKSNEELDNLRNEFDFNCDKALTELNQLKDKAKSPPNKLIILGITMISVMILIPIFNQIKAAVVVKKTKKIQEKLSKLQRDQAETQRLLSDDSNIISLNS